jgi:hypothetical protein
MSFWCEAINTQPGILVDLTSQVLDSSLIRACRHQENKLNQCDRGQHCTRDLKKKASRGPHDVTSAGQVPSINYQQKIQ